MGDAPGVAWTEHDLARLGLDAGRFDEAAALFQRSLDHFRASGHSIGVAYAVGNPGRTQLMLGEVKSAARCLDEALAWFRTIGHERGEAWTLCNLAWLDAERDRAETAWTWLVRALNIFAAQSYALGRALCAVVAARLIVRDQPRFAARLLGMADQLQMLSATDRLRSDQVRAILREHVDE
jgi:hypothetical protein